MLPTPEFLRDGHRMKSSKRKKRRSEELLEAMSQAEDHRLEIENRIRNLFWTVSGDYSLECRPDVDTFIRSKSLALYDAIKQGAFASHYDAHALAVYTLKKRALGANPELLTELTQLCVDAAAYPIVSRERSGICEIRQQAFRDLLETGYFRGDLGAIRLCILNRFLGLEDNSQENTRHWVDFIEELAGASDTSQIIAAIDTLYNSLVDPSFASSKGDLKAVLRVTNAQLLEYQRDLAIDDETMQTVLDEYLSNLKDELLKTNSFRSDHHRRMLPQAVDSDEDTPEPNPEDAAKIYAFMERQFGKSSLTRQEQERVNQRLCTGFHRRCSLYFTSGILSNPAVKNTQYLRTSMQAMKNEMYFNMKQLPIRRSIAVLSAMLQQVQIQRLDEESSRADFGQIIPNRLWKLGRTEDTKLFDRIQRKENSAFVVDILLDSSSSQNLRQPQIAAQGYIISQSLSLAGIPHRVHSFCSYWDYTMLHCFRDYDDGPEGNKNILQFRAFGENRDGLAIRTVCDSLKERSEENKILIILSDGRPNNLGSMRPGIRKPTPYVGEEAIKDTAFEIRKARNQGIRVLGIFVGNEEDLYAEKKIFGKEFTYTRNISSFAHIVGRYLRKLMEQDM